MKYPVSIILILLIGVQTFSKWCLIIEYQANRDFIARTLCINRNIVSCCKGTCYLNKKMATDESQQQTPGKGGQKEEPVWQAQQTDILLSHPLIAPIRLSHSTRHLTGESQGYILSFFPPPRAAEYPA
jgi:hypothetical protein